MSFLLRAMLLAFLVSVVGVPASASTRHDAKAEAEAEFARALELIHTHRWGSDASTQAMSLARALSQKHPKSGFAQVLKAEYLSTWQVNAQGQPTAVAAMALELTDEALALNPRLAHAHVARARVHLRTNAPEKAKQAIHQALSLDSKMASAFFLRGELHRRQGRIEEADHWYRKFISGVSPRRQSNGYRWIAEMHVNRAIESQGQDQVAVAKARKAFERMLVLSQGEDWGHLDHAIFLNGVAGDHEAAERHLAVAQAELGHHPLWRAHWAAARYLQLLVAASKRGHRVSLDAVASIHAETQMSLEEAIDFDGFGLGIVTRLHHLKTLLQQDAVARI